jgi:hypothetical protein
MQKSTLACMKLQRYSVTSSGKSGEMKPGMSMPGGKPKRSQTHGNPQPSPSNGVKVDGKVQRLGSEQPKQ